MLKLENTINKSLSFSEEVEWDLFRLFDGLMNTYGFHYMFFALEDIDSSSRHSFSTDPAWQDSYIGQKLINDCPLYAALEIFYKKTNNNNGIILPWDAVPHENKKQNQVMQIRSEHGIETGLTMAIKSGSFRIILGLGVDHYNREYMRLVTLDSIPLKSSFNRAIQISTGKINELVENKI